MRRDLLYLVLIVPLLAPLGVRAERISATSELQAVQDNTLFADPDGSLSSGAGTAVFCGNNSQRNTRRALVVFDVASQLPAGATIDSVTVRMFVTSAPNDTPQRIAMHRLLADWGEGSSISNGGSGAASTPGDATWRHTFYPGSFWSTPGGDFASTESAGLTVDPSGAHVWSGPGLAADVQLWVDQPDQQFGWILVGNESSASTVRRFDSREATIAENRPTLTVHYSHDTTAIQATTWSALKCDYLAPTWRTP